MLTQSVPAVGRAGPLPVDAERFVVVVERRGHGDAGLDRLGVRGERYRARLFHVLDCDRDGLCVVDGGGREAGAVPPVVHLDVDAVAGLRLEVQSLARAQLAGARNDGEGGGVRAAQRVRQAVVLRVFGGDGSADVDVRPRVLRHGALAGLGGGEDGAAVLAGDEAVRDRLRSLAAAAVVRVGDAGAQVEVSIVVIRRVPAGRRAEDVYPAGAPVLGPRPLPGFAADVAVAVFEGGLQLRPDLRLSPGRG